MVTLFVNDSALVRGLMRAQQRLRNFGQSIQAVGQMFLGMGTTALLPVGLAVKRFADFDDVMREVKAVTKATDADFATLTETAKNLGATTSFTALQVGALMAELGRAGFKPDQVNAMTDAVLNLSRATKTEAAMSAGIMASAIRQFGLGAEDATMVADAFTTTANGTFNTVEMLGEAMSYAGKVASDFGLSVQDTLAILGGLGNVGIQGSNAGTAMRRLLTLTGAEAQKLQGIFGVSFVDATGNARPLVDVLGEVNEATKDLGTGVRAAKFNEAFGLLGITAASAIGSAAGDIKGLAKTIKEESGSAAKAAAAMDAGIGGSFRILMSAAEGVAISIGESLNGEIQALASYLTNVAGSIRDFIQKNRDLIVTLVKVAAGVTAFGATLVIVGASSIAASTAIGGITAAMSLMSGVVGIGMTAMRAFGATAVLMSGVVSNAIKMAVGTFTLQLGVMASAHAFFATLFGDIASIVASLFSPIGLAVAGVALVVGGLVFAFWKLADPLTALMPLASAVMAAFKGIAGALINRDFAGAFEIMASSIRTIMLAAARGVIDLWKNTLTNLIGLVTGTSGGIVGGLSTISTAAKRIFGEVWEAGKVALGALALFANDVFSQAPQIIGFAFGLAIRQVALAVMKLQDWMGQVFLGFVDTLFSSFANMGPGLIRAMLTGDIAGALNAIGPAVQKALRTQALAASGMAAGLFGGEMPEFKMSPETIAAYEKMAESAKVAEKATGSIDTAAPGATGPASALPSTVANPGEEAVSPSDPVNPEIPKTEIAQYKERLAELSAAFAASTITAEEFATGLSALKADALKIDATPLEQYDSRLEMLNQALADGTITQREWKSAVADARDEIFSLASSPLDDFRARVVTLQQAFQSGAISAQEYGKQLADAKREILGIETSQLDQFGERIKELQEQLKAGAITKDEFDNAFKTSQQNFLGIDTDPIDQFKKKLSELRAALDKGLITKDQFKTAAMDALPSRVKQIIDETRTPMEKYKADMAELDKLKGAGLIDKDTHARKQKQIAETRDGATAASTKPTTFGSFSASALIDSGRGTGANGITERMHELSKEQGKLTAEQLAELKELRKAFSKLAEGMRSV